MYCHVGAYEDEASRQEAVDRSPALRLRGDARLVEVAEMAAAYYGTDFAAVSIIDRDRQVLLSRVGMDVEVTARGEAFCAVAIQRPGEALVVPDARADPRFASYAAVQEAPFVRFYAGVPILDLGGYALGALCIADTRPMMMPKDLVRLTMLGLKVEALLSRGG